MVLLNDKMALYTNLVDLNAGNCSRVSRCAYNYVRGALICAEIRYISSNFLDRYCCRSIVVQFLKRTFSQFMVFKVTGCHAMTGTPLPASWRLLVFNVIITFTHS